MDISSIPMVMNRAGCSSGTDMKPL